MAASYVTAALTSLAFGAPTFVPNRYRYWARYVANRPRRLVFLGLQGVTYLAAGLLVAVFAHALGAQSLWGEGVLSGFVYGLVPHGLARVPLPGVPKQRLADPTSPFGRMLNWFRQWLDDLAYSSVRERINGLDDGAVIDVTWDLFWQSYWTDKKISDAVKATQHEALREGAKQIRNETDVSDGRGRLRNFCIGEISRKFDPDY